MKPLSYLYLIATLCIYGCESETTTTPINNDPVIPTTTVKDLFPLAVGNKWTYLHTDYDTPSGEVKGTSTIQGIVTKATTYNSLPAFEITTNGVPSIYYYSGTGIYFAEGVNKPSLLSVSYPIKAGEVKVLSSYVDNNGTSWRLTAKVVSEDTTITVPKGSFKCKHFEFVTEYFNTGSPKHPWQSNDSYYAVDVGRVLTVVYSYFNDDLRYLFSTEELTDYTVK